jgi:hypothetical protein
MAVSTAWKYEPVLSAASFTAGHLPLPASAIPWRHPRPVVWTVKYDLVLIST